MAKCKLDLHADTCVLGWNFKLIELTGEVVDVVPYHEEYEAKKDVLIVSAAMAWTHPDTGEMFQTTIKHCGMAKRLPTVC